MNTKAERELRREIAELRAELAALKAKLDSLPLVGYSYPIYVPCHPDPCPPIGPPYSPWTCAASDVGCGHIT